MAPIYDCSVETELLTGMRLARTAIGRGDLVVIPTDTVYGVAADAFNPAAVQKLIDAKGRTRQSPPPVLIPGIPTLDALAESVPDEVRALVAAFWPGGLTIILPAQSSLAWDLGETRGTVALRMPSNRIALELLSETGPLAVSSANLTGRPAATTAQDAEHMLGDSVAPLPRRRRGGRARLDHRGRHGPPLAGGQAPDRARRGHPGGGHPRPRGGRAVRIVFYVLVSGVSAAVTFGMAVVIWKLSTKYRLYPKIRARDVHTRPTPRLGGVAMFLGMVVAFLVASQIGSFSIVFTEPGKVLGVGGAALIIVLIGVADDIWDLDWLTKLAGQIIAAGILAWQGVQVSTLPIAGQAIVSPYVSLIITVFAIVLVMNAINFIDGLDGLVAGVALIANGVFFVYVYLLQLQAQTEYFNLASLITAVLIGACVGFLPLNFHPAKLFMGDAGALLTGLLMASSAILVTGQVNSDFATGPNQYTASLVGAFIPILLPFAVLVVPLLDFGLAITRRLRAGKSPFTADRKHLHHRLLDMGHSHLHAVLIFYGWTLVVSAGLLAYMFVPALGATLLIAVGLIILTVITLSPLSKRKALEAVAQSTGPYDTDAAADVARYDGLDAASEGASEGHELHEPREAGT